MKAAQPSRRSRSNDGTPNRVSRIVPIDPGLLSKLMASFYEPIVRRGPRIFHGPNVAHSGERSNQYGQRFTDEQVMVIRKMREWHGMTAHQIAEALGCRETQVAPIVRWSTRTHIDPGPRPAPPVEAGEH
jgi:hypothetical protein